MEKNPDLQAVRNHEPQKKRWVEPAIALVMALTTIGTAWCSYQSAAWTRQSNRLMNEYNALERRAGLLNVQGGGRRIREARYRLEIGLGQRLRHFAGGACAKHKQSRLLSRFIAIATQPKRQCHPSENPHPCLECKSCRAFCRPPASTLSRELDPLKFQIFKTDQAIDIMRNPTTTPPDHIRKFSYKAGGGRIAALFDGTEKVVSWDSFPWYIRTVSAP